MASVSQKTILSDIPNVDPQCWDGCVQGLADHFKADNLTTEKVAQKAGIIFVALASLIFISALMVQYPTAARTFFTLLGLGAVASLVTMVVSITRYCKEKNIQSEELEGVRETIGANVEEIEAVQEVIPNLVSQVDSSSLKSE